MEPVQDDIAGCGTCLVKPPDADLCPTCDRWIRVQRARTDAWLSRRVRFDAYCARRDAVRSTRGAPWAC